MGTRTLILFYLLLCLATEPGTVSGSWKGVNKYMQEGGREGIRKTDGQDIARNSESVRIIQLQAST